MKYRKTPLVVEAFRLGHEPLPDWLLDAQEKYTVYIYNNTRPEGVRPNDAALIITLEGRMYAEHGDWIIQGVMGEIYPCKPEIFDITYERMP